MALTKNNPALRGEKQQDKTYEGKPVKPSLYVGPWVGHGKYMAATQDNGKFVTDNNGKPVPYSSL